MQRFLPAIRAAVSVAALGSIGFGLYCIFPPAAFVVVGGLVWWDVR